MSGCYRSERPAELNLRILLDLDWLSRRARCSSEASLSAASQSHGFSVGRLNSSWSFAQADTRANKLQE